MKVGIDFGTTNSAVAAVDASGTARILQLVPGEDTQRTVIFVDPKGELVFGNAAFTAYLEADLRGRLLRSLKTFLADDVPPTRLGYRWYEFVDLVAAYVKFLLAGAERVLGEPVTEVVVGRPVKFNEDPVKASRALAQLRAALERADLPSYSLELEPVAAARQYRTALTTERTVLVGDFGGGTADFAILRVGPRGPSGSGGDDVLGTSGVALAGDALDAVFVTQFLSPYFGKDAPYSDASTGRRRWDPDILRQIPRLYDIHRFRDRELAEVLDRMERRVDDPRVVRRLRRLVFDDLGYPLARAIEATKRELSPDRPTRFRFDEFHSEALDLEFQVTSASFGAASDRVLGHYAAAVASALAQAGRTPDGIDDVFLTGGTSQLPFVRRLFERTFGAGKLRAGHVFTSVCEGLALS